MLRVLSKGLWSVIASKSKSAGTRRAAIAYLGESPPIKFGSGDLLIVDASDASIKAGRTSAKVLRTFHKAGVDLWSHSNLHAKVMLLDDWAVVGSANASRQSKNTYVEAAVVTDRPDIASQVERFISELKDRSDRIGPTFIKHICALPVIRTPFFAQARGVKRQAPKVEGPRTWLLSLRSGAAYPGDEERVDAVTEEEQDKLGRRGGEIDWFWWSGEQGFPAKAKVGDIIIESWRPRAEIKSTRSVRVYRHARLVRIFQESGQKAKTFHRLFPPDAERTAVSWSGFSKLAVRAGITRKLSYRSSIQLNEQQSNALFELWPK